VPGIQRDRRCVAAPRGTRTAHSKRCTRLTLVGSFRHRDHAGGTTLHFSGRLRGRVLKPGAYLLKARPSLDSHRGESVSARFWILT
jgi:hypothetical protein